MTVNSKGNWDTNLDWEKVFIAGWQVIHAGDGRRFPVPLGLGGLLFPSLHFNSQPLSMEQCSSHGHKYLRGISTHPARL